MRFSKRGLVLLVSVLTGLAFTGTASPSATIPIDISMTVDALTRPGGCCTDTTTSSPTTVVLPRLGRVTLSASLSVCGVTRCLPNGATNFSVSLEAPSGDTIHLFGSTDSGSLGNQSGSGTWTAGGTGRFAQVSGSGTWSAAAAFVGPGSPAGTPTLFTFSVIGSIKLRA
jgi:hypothetical protein